MHKGPVGSWTEICEACGGNIWESDDCVDTPKTDTYEYTYLKMEDSEGINLDRLNNLGKFGWEVKNVGRRSYLLQRKLTQG